MLQPANKSDRMCHRVAMTMHCDMYCPTVVMHIVADYVSSMHAVCFNAAAWLPGLEVAQL